MPLIYSFEWQSLPEERYGSDMLARARRAIEAAEMAHAPVVGWPAEEILTAMSQTPVIGPLIPIDILGMVTNLNPSNYYLKEK